MAYRGKDGFSTGENSENNSEIIQLQGGETHINLPDAAFVRDADMTRDGMDLVLETQGGTVTIEGYFAAEPAPSLVSPDGSTLTPDLVQSFAHSPAEFAQNLSMMDISPVGQVKEFSGEASVTRTDGTVDKISLGTPIYEGDIIETGADGAVNISFVDETSFAVSENARMAIDEYSYDASSESGTQDFSVLKGMFVFTSGLIGRDDPDDVNIETPVGSIGIRGTIIAGNVDTGEITVVEGAIVLRDFNGNEVTLADQFETAKFDSSGGSIEHIGVLEADEVSDKFSTVAEVSPQLFSSINDAANEQDSSDTQVQEQNDASGSVDENNDSQVDGTVDESSLETSKDTVEVVAEAQPEAVVEPSVETKFGNDTSGLDARSSEPVVLDTRLDVQKTTTTRVANTETKPIIEPTSSTATKIEFPPLVLDIQNTGGLEGTSGSIVGMIRGSAELANLTLTGAAVALYDVVRIDSSTFGIRYIGSGTSVDHEQSQTLPAIGFTAVDVYGRSIIGGMAPNVINTWDEDPVLVNGTPAQNFNTVENSVWRVDLKSIFGDKEIVHGDLLDFVVNGLPGGSTFNIVGGVLEVTFGSYATDQAFTLDITATDRGGNWITFSETFNVYDINDGTAFTGGSTGLLVDLYDDGSNLVAGGVGYTGTNKVFNGGAGVDVLDLTSVSTSKIFTGAGDDAVKLGGSGNILDTNVGDDDIAVVGVNNKVFAGDGRDDIVVSGFDNTVWAGNGDDNITLEDMDNHILGGGGDDKIRIDLGAISQTMMQDAAVSGYVIDGGADMFSWADKTGGDMVRFDGAGNLDFTAINNPLLRNIEGLDFKNGGAANNVALDFQDIFDMTDGKKTLVIGLDSSDTLTFETNGETVTQGSSFTDSNGDTFDVYNITGAGGEKVTLVVETDGVFNQVPA